MIKLIFVFLLYSSNIVFTEANEIAYVCKPNITDMANIPILNLTEYCMGSTTRPCVPKCCKHNEVLYTTTKGNKNDPEVETEYEVTCTKSSILGINESNYEMIQIYNKNIEISKEQIKASNFLNDFNLVHNRMFENETCGGRYSLGDWFLLNDGKLALDLEEELQLGWIIVKPEYFCVDINFFNETRKTKVTCYVASEPDTGKTDFVGVALLVSSAFLMLTFLVYCVLPQLRNLSGMLLMAYMATLCIAYVFHSIRMLFADSLYPETVIVIDEIYYFGCISSFFWLNIMSYDIWWTFRGQRLKREINRRGKVVKFIWYSLYGWGAPSAVSIVANVIDYYRDELPHVTPPRFDLSMTTDDSATYYIYVPIGTLIMTNFILFWMTVYNICVIKKKLSKFNESSNSTKKNENRLWIYMKMSMLMGVSWILELITLVYPEKLPEWLFILLNWYNALIGVIIFIMFVLNRKTLKMLCQRFNIRCSFLESKKFRLNTSSSKSTTTNGSSHTSDSARTVDSYMEMADAEISFNPNPTNKNKFT